jgi:hypothetical protein
MKKLLAAGMLAICLIAASQQQASAWVKFNFGIGFNVGWQTGGNSLLWGAWENGQPPGMPYYYGGHHGHHHSYAPSYSYAPHAFAPMPMPTYEPSYAPYYYANNPGPVYYQPAPYYYGR